MRKLLLISLLIIGGCASEQELQLAYMAQVDIVQAQASIQDKDTFTIDCSKGGCGGAVIHYLDPRDRNRINIPDIKGTNDVIIETIPSVTHMFTWAVGAFAVTEIIEDITHNSGSNNTSTSTNINGSDNTVDNNHSTQGNTSSSIQDSENSSTIDSNDDNSNVTDSNDDNSNYSDSNDDNSQQNQTSPPTIVVQPAPVVVVSE